ncbi:hypothetical protein NB688_000552 [Xanthomonas sacchari]|uniref:Uncharacterized protein n=1 Tax=Xanthomonas sacchari TaxID=56458 RepID=A0ABT3DTD9_9XANT|nr:hypothetical protein [Xanthomonas sacchari]MCW0398738.1 hypothetical protein [Xanthomonas sacchari]MCW0418386.1 hypothetical protein [Xanthomonas sacchari]UYK72553.1 hypothetical protein NG828_20590 [Xanthomonas sacchari]
MKVQTVQDALRLCRSWQTSSKKAGRRLRRANALLEEAARVLHDLPDQHCPNELLERVRLHLHATSADPIPDGATEP